MMKMKSSDHASAVQPLIQTLGVSAYSVPTDFPESDGTLEWDRTTIVIVEASDGTWSMYVKLSWKVGEHLVAVYRSAQPKRYKSLSAAVAHCRAAYHYRGSIILETEIQEPLPHDEPPSHH